MQLWVFLLTQYAVGLDRPIMNRDWISRVWTERDSLDFKADDQDMVCVLHFSFLCPSIDGLGGGGGKYSSWSIPLFVCLSTKTFTLAIFFDWSDLGPSYFTCVYLVNKTFLFVPSLRSSVKVEYQGHSFRKSGDCEGICVSQTQLVFLTLSQMVNFRLFQIERVFR